MEPITCAEWIGRVEAAETRGDFLSAIDAADRALTLHPGEIELDYLATLAMARSGSTGEARRRFAGFCKQARTASRESRITPALAEKVEALGARILKDEAYLGDLSDRANTLRLAAEEYQRVYLKFGSLFTCINAASLFHLAGNAERAKALALEAVSLGSKQKKSKKNQAKGYFFHASLAEANFVLGEEDKAKELLAKASAAKDAKATFRATTVRQFERLLENSALNADDFLEDIRNSTVIHFCGHMIGDEKSRFPSQLVPKIRRQIEARLKTFNVGYGIGSLACGADILFAEALIKRGAELTVVLPFDKEKFIATSVRHGGRGWEKRFRYCLKNAKGGVRYATDSGYLGDPELYRYGSRLAMGLAVLTAERLQTDVRQIAIWDQQKLGAVGGTEESHAYWTGNQRPSDVIPLPASKTARPGSSGEKKQGNSKRSARVMLFGDIKGFSKLKDAQLPEFVKMIMGTVASVLAKKPYKQDLVFCNTWGDGIFLVFNDTVKAANFALELQAELADLNAKGLPEGLELRLGAHVGPTFELKDPVLGKKNIYGAHITRAARLEPVARGGSVYTTEAFAATIALETGTELRCEYIGNIAAAKDFGDMPVYVLCQ